MELFIHNGLPKAWAEALAEARKQHPDTCILLICKATATIRETDWLPEQAETAERIIHNLPRAKARARRLRGLAKRLSAARRRKEADAARHRKEVEAEAKQKAEEAEFIPGLLP